MGSLHILALNGHKFLSDSYILSKDPILPKTATELLYAQRVVESQWLVRVPTYVFKTSEGPVSSSRVRAEPPDSDSPLADMDVDEMSLRLYENVRLPFPEYWADIDADIDTFLLNEAMYELLRPTESGTHPFSLKAATPEEFAVLLENQMFVVAMVDGSYKPPVNQNELWDL